jgi:hypothetical protein
MALALNHALALAVEAWMVWAVARWGYGLGPSPAARWGLAQAVVVVALALWGRVAAPKAARRLSGAKLLSFKVAAVATGAAATLPVYGMTPAAAFFVIALAQLSLALWLDAL